MKLFHVATTKNYGPGTVVECLVREEDETKAIEAAIDPTQTPFEGIQEPLTKFWHNERLPQIADFVAREIGKDLRWAGHSFSAELRDPEQNKGPVLSNDQTLCRDFMADRVVMRKFKPGGYLDKLIFSLKLYTARKFREFADWIDESKTKYETTDDAEKD